jgi:hypothetical protein
MEFRDDTLVIDKQPSELDTLVIDVTDLLESVGVEYSIVSGYVAVLLGRSRATEDIDIVTERFDERTAEALVEKFRDAGYWGTAMPLDQMYETLVDDLPVRVAEEDHRVPNVELKFAADQYDRASLTNTVTVRLIDEDLTVGSLELQIAYKLGMGAEKDFEDALYLLCDAGTKP